MFAKTVLLVAAAMFAALGALFLVAPDKLEEWLGVAATRPEARTELRALYGGLELGIAVFLAMCALRSPWTGVGCVALVTLNGGIASARITGFVLDGTASGKMLGFLGIEVAMIALGLWAWRSVEA